MRKILFIVITVCFLASVAYATETFISVTKDNEVTNINQVKITKRIIEEKHIDKTYTLSGIDAQIAKIQARIEHLQGDITELQALRALVLDKAEEVKLKVDEPPEKEIK